ELSPSARKIQQALEQRGVKLQVVELKESTRTSQEAAQAIGCEVGQIVKSVIFKARRSERPILVIASGVNRVDERKIEELIGEPLGKADADFVRARTGFVIGGVPPICHDEPIQTFIDQDLLSHRELWAAAGTPNAVFRLTPDELLFLSDGKVAPVKLE
ncbi:MAG: YbaK/EbsC family protein, partial [Anaerolineales bacterium]|nr:YbaK/EbsC family protein [Anaerolineales bacterium]